MKYLLLSLLLISCGRVKVKTDPIQIEPSVHRIEHVVVFDESVHTYIDKCEEYFYDDENQKDKCVDAYIKALDKMEKLKEELEFEL